MVPRPARRGGGCGAPGAGSAGGPSSRSSKRGVRSPSSPSDATRQRRCAAGHAAAGAQPARAPDPRSFDVDKAQRQWVTRHPVEEILSTGLRARRRKTRCRCRRSQVLEKTACRSSAPRGGAQQIQMQRCAARSRRPASKVRRAEITSSSREKSGGGMQRIKLGTCWSCRRRRARRDRQRLKKAEKRPRRGRAARFSEDRRQLFGCTRCAAGGSLGAQRTGCRIFAGAVRA